MTINPYINFQGQTEEAFNFYQSVFGGDFAAVMRFAEMPGCDEAYEHELSAEDKDKIMHIALPVGNNGDVLMGTDALESQGQTLTEGNNFSIAVSPDNRDETERIFAGLADGGSVEMPLSDTFWGAYFGMLKDKYGVRWMINYDQNMS
jgi:PhnB protein